MVADQALGLCERELNVFKNLSTHEINSIYTHVYIESLPHTCPRKVSSHWATSDNNVTRQKLKFSATGRVSATKIKND